MRHENTDNHHQGIGIVVAFLVLLISLFVVAEPLVGQELGRIVYLEGDVEVIRDGSVRSGYDIAIGEPVLELDVIQTGRDGYAEIELSRPAKSNVRVLENSAYYVEITENENGNTVTRLKLLSGTLEIAVERVTQQRLDVETRTAVFGVRGTKFDVLTAPDESALLGVREGRVAATVGRDEQIVPAGTAAQSIPDQAIRQETVPNGDFQGYYDQWTETRLQVFRSGATTFVRAYARRYLDTVGSFRQAYRDLIAYRPRLEAATRAEGSSLGTDMRLRQEISPALITMRSILPIFENTVYRLRELYRFHQQGIGTTTIDDQSSAQFFRGFAMQERDLLIQLTEVRTMFRMYQKIEERSFGGLPGGGSPFGGQSPDFLNSMQF